MGIWGGQQAGKQWTDWKLLLCLLDHNDDIMTINMRHYQHVGARKPAEEQQIVLKLSINEMRNYPSIVCSDLFVRLPAEADSFPIGRGSFASMGISSFLFNFWVVCRCAWLILVIFYLILVVQENREVTVSRRASVSLWPVFTPLSQLCHLFLYLDGITQSQNNIH